MSIVRPYGDTTGDGRVQLSFTLPVPFGDETERARAEGAALQLAAKMGLDPAMVVHAKGMGPDFTFFIVYGRVSHLVDLSAVTVTEREFPVLPAAEVNLRIRSALGRKLVVVGACIGTDAHTVGIDAILNVKGHAGEKGLEYYREIRVVNMGAQVGVADLVARAAAEHADAVLVSQVVTQRDAHLSNTREMSAAFHAGFGLQRPLLVVGGPRFDPSAAHDLGVDKIFGRGTTPSEVASYLVHALVAQGVPGGWSPPGRKVKPHESRGPVGDAAPVREVRGRPLRREPGGRRVRAWAVRRRGDRGVHPDGRRRGAVRVLLRRAVPRAGAGRGHHRGHRHGHRGRAAQQAAGLRGPGGVPGRPGARRVGRRGAQRADRGRHRRRHRRGTAAAAG